MAPPVGNPIPASAVALCAALPLIGWSAWRLARAANRDARLAAWAAPGVAVALWALAMHASSYLLRSFHAGLWVGTLLAAASGLLTLRAPLAPAAWPRPSRALLVTALATLALILPATLLWAFHDELYFTGHMSIAAELQNGLYPPVRLTFPTMELGYHYGFSTLVAALSGLLRLPLPWAIDALSLACWVAIWGMTWALGERLLRRAWLLPVVLMLGAGLPFGSVPEQLPLASDLLGLRILAGLPLNPPMISYFFQHPWAVGLPVALAALLLLSDRDPQPPRARYALFALLVASLAILQLVLFLTLAATLLAVEVAGSPPWRPDRRRLLPMAVATVAAVAVGASLGGFFARNPDVGGVPLAVRFPLLEEPAEWIEWTVRSFGLVLPLGVVGLALRPAPTAAPLRLAAALLAAGGVAIINVLTYRHSWDILKFATIAHVGLAVGAALALDAALSSSRALLRRAAAFALAPTVAAGLAFPLVFALDLPGIEESLYHRAPAPLTADDAAAVAWLRTEVGSTHLVYRNDRHTNGWAQWGGVAQPWFESVVPKFGFSKERLERRLAILGSLPAAPAPWRREEICWFALDPSDARLLAAGAAWVAAGEATWVRDFGALRILHLHGCGAR